MSLGGNVFLKYLGESKPHMAVTAAAAVSSPIDLLASVRVLDQKLGNHFYLKRLIRRLVCKVRAKARHFPGYIDASRTRGIHGFEDFDERFTAPIHGFCDALDYWPRSSSKQFLPAITVPTLVLSARDDPFLSIALSVRRSLTKHSPLFGGAGNRCPLGVFRCSEWRANLG
jgi:predicted alpha/beta-fold hydrolase